MQSRLNLDAYMRALAYLLGGVFLLSLGGTTLIDKVFGWGFGVISLVLMFIAISHKFTGFGDRVNKWFILSLFIVSIARLDMMVLDTRKVEFIVLGVVFPLLAISG